MAQPQPHTNLESFAGEWLRGEGNILYCFYLFSCVYLMFPLPSKREGWSSVPYNLQVCRYINRNLDHQFSFQTAFLGIRVLSKTH